MSEQDIFNALMEAYSRAGTQAKLAEKAGMSQGRIADYLNKRCSVSNMTVSTLFRLFPNLEIDFFGIPAGITVNGDNTGAIAQGDNANAKTCLMARNGVIDKSILESQILHEESFSDSERIKFLLFLDDKVK